MTVKRTNLAVNAERKLKLERYAVDVSYKIGKSMSWTDFANYVLDNYAKEASLDLIHTEKEIQKK
ncbi:hypothetical protein RHO13_13215 (plasmid) [Orbus wheelerorum]|uniref:hypothetical protein n=1 Tax=Orbus wheelerorum TaxID=3074111 RepID=UPI00370D5506